jgi:NAD(P)H dehydrogenase (quinone)
MCFASKRQEDNFAETRTDKSPATATVSSQHPPPILPTTDAQTINMSGPKIAIVIYTMYGHVAKRMFY